MTVFNSDMGGEQLDTIIQILVDAWLGTFWWI